MTDLIEAEGWHHVGRIEVHEGKLQSPKLPDVPGVYCLQFANKSRYYGEAGDLNRRIGDYLLYYASTGIESEFRVNKALRESNGAEVYIQTGDKLKSKSERCIIESKLKKKALNSKLTLVNSGTIPDRIAFHASEIVRLSAQLTRSEQSNGEHA